jgi:ribonuclease P protein component
MQVSRRLPRQNRIRQRADFTRTYDLGTKLHGRLMTVFVRENGHGRSRLGIAATRKIGGAVVRNRAKRLTRELFRHLEPQQGLDIVVVPRREFPNAPFSALEHELTTLLDRSTHRPSRR